MANTRVIEIDRDRPEPALIAEAAACIASGGLVAFATETVYGLGADATRTQAIERIYTAKGRPPTNPLIVHVSDLAMARQFARSWCLDAELLGQAGWPGPLTLVVEKVAAVVDLATAGLPSVGLRVPATGVARALIETAGVPIAAPSANRSEHVSPTTAQHVLDDLQGEVDIILDSGSTKMGIESAVIDLTGEQPRVLRPGPVRVEDLERVIGRPFDREAPPRAAAGPKASPGQHARHYAPRTTCLRVNSETELQELIPSERDAVYAFIEIDDAAIVSAFASATHPVRAAAELYATLRAMDAEGFDRILIVMPPDQPGWEAVRDRLQRASTPAAEALQAPR